MLIFHFLWISNKIIFSFILNLIYQDNIMDIKKTNLEISLIKNPIVFLFYLISWRNELTDENLSICLRLYLKHHLIVALEYNLKKIFRDELYEYKKSWNVLKDFYKLIDKKLALIFILKKWHSVYLNEKFWKLSISQQTDYLQLIKERFFGIYDCSKGGIPYYVKLSYLLKSSNNNRIELMEDGINRLKIILEIFGPDLFHLMYIPLISIEDYWELTNENLIKYFIIIFEKFSELLNQTIKLFDSYNLICIQINNLVNPISVKIKSEFIDSETECDHIKLFCEKI
jgi:hypothetical protein